MGPAIAWPFRRLAAGTRFLGSISLNSTRPQNSTPRRWPLRERGRLWLLALLLVGVLWMMHELGQPETASQLGRLFLLSDTKAADAGGESTGADTTRASAVPRAGADVAAPTPDAQIAPTVAARDQAVQDVDRRADNSVDPGKGPPGSSTSQQAWEAVRDNSVFLSGEQPAWLALLQEMKQADPARLAQQTLGAVSYAQLRSQPDEYRGRVITIRGTALRAEPTKPAVNDLGIDSYYRVVIAPHGGGQWPVIAYCLSLPDGFPRGSDIQQPVVVHGAFFKNWSYSYGDGFGLAPIVVASTLDWRPPAPPPTAPRANHRQILWALVGCAVAASLIVGLVWAQTKRKPQRLEPSSDVAESLAAVEAFDEDVGESLQALARREDG